LGRDIAAARTVPSVIMFFIYPTYIVQAVFTFEKSIEMVAEGSNIALSIALIIITIHYGINPTIQKTTAISNLSRLRI